MPAFAGSSRLHMLCTHLLAIVCERILSGFPMGWTGTLYHCVLNWRGVAMCTHLLAVWLGGNENRRVYVPLSHTSHVTCFMPCYATSLKMVSFLCFCIFVTFCFFFFFFLHFEFVPGRTGTGG